MAMYAINYDGLRKRDTYNEIIDYLQFHQEKIIYPDRFAKRVRETPQLSNSCSSACPKPSPSSKLVN